MQFVAAGFLVYDLTSNAVLLAILAVINRGPSVVLALAAGRIADRPDAMRVAMALLGLQAVGGIALGVSVEAGADSLAMIYVISTVMGVAAALNGPALQVVVPAAAPPSLHDEAVRLNSSGYNVARAAGPLVGGLLLGTVGPGWCFVVNGASFVAVLAALSGLQLHREAIPDRQRAGVLDSLRSAARNPAARTIMVWLALFSAAVAPVQELAAAIAKEHVDGAHGVGALVGALAIGTVAGVWVARALVARAVPRSLQLTLFTLGCALGVIGLAALQPFGATLAMTVVVGLCWCVVYTVALNAVQLILPAELTGRMLGLFQLVTAIGLTVGPLVSGVLTDALDLELSLAASGVLMGGLAAFGLLRMTHPLDFPARGSDQPAREFRGRWATALIHRPLPD